MAPGLSTIEEPDVPALALAGGNAAEQFGRLAIDLHDSTDVEETVDAVVQFALHALDCSHAGIALAVARGQLEIPAVTDPVVAEIYQSSTSH